MEEKPEQLMVETLNVSNTKRQSIVLILIPYQQGYKGACVDSSRRCNRVAPTDRPAGSIGKPVSHPCLDLSQTETYSRIMHRVLNDLLCLCWFD